MTIDELQKAQVAKLKELFPKLGNGRGQVDTHGGRFDLSELATISTQTPAIFVAFLSIKKVEECGDGRFSINGTYVAYTVTTSKKDLDRDVAGKNMSEAIAKWLPNNRFGLIDVGTPEGIAATNLYSGKAKSKAVALWAVTWEQTVTGDESDFPSEPLPENLYIGNELQEEL